MRRYNFLFILAIAGCSIRNHSCTYISREEPALGTFVNVTINKIPHSESILDNAFLLIKSLEKKFSIYIEDSEVSQLNRNKKIKVSDEMKHVIEKSIHISQLTTGAFDITVLPLIKLYREAEKKGVPPSDEEIRKVLQYIGYEKIKIKNNIIQIPDKAEIDTGGIAKGYIVDRTAELLQKNGITDGLVNAGGDIYCFGKNPEGRKWKVAIRDPFNKDRVLQTVHLSGYGIATSGDYERYLTIRSKKYGHIVNPLTGKTVQNFPVSVTVIAPDTITADGLATAFYVMGVKESLKIAENMDNIAIFIVDGDGKTYKSKNFSYFTTP